MTAPRRRVNGAILGARLVEGRRIAHILRTAKDFSCATSALSTARGYREEKMSTGGDFVLTGREPLHISAVHRLRGLTFARLCGLVFPTSNQVDRPWSEKSVAAVRVIDRLGGGVFAGSLTIWFEERES